MNHRSRLAHFVIDVDDLDQGVAFWSAALDAKEEPLSEASSQVYRRLRLPDSEVRILLQRTADLKSHKELMHLDLETDDVEAEVRRLEAFGATRYDHQQERGYGIRLFIDQGPGLRPAARSACPRFAAGRVAAADRKRSEFKPT